ncbi:hypothetical protein C8T65DRAFT_300398 [Cerioporus squamosus]|nr:hypothetical protein C8T65DRAFT_300398 [Cerioporus squamosus]
MTEDMRQVATMKGTSFVEVIQLSRLANDASSVSWMRSRSSQASLTSSSPATSIDGLCRSCTILLPHPHDAYDWTTRHQCGRAHPVTPPPAKRGQRRKCIAAPRSHHGVGRSLTALRKGSSCGMFIIVAWSSHPSVPHSAANAIDKLSSSAGATEPDNPHPSEKQRLCVQVLFASRERLTVEPLRRPVAYAAHPGLRHGSSRPLDVFSQKTVDKASSEPWIVLACSSAHHASPLRLEARTICSRASCKFAPRRSHASSDRTYFQKTHTPLN